MAIKSVTKSEKKATPRRAASSSPAAKQPSPAPVRTAARGTSKDDDRTKILKERFCPEGIQYLKDTFGLDLTSPSVPVKDLYKLSDGRVTDPLEAVVRPVAYDRQLKRNVEMPPIQIVGSFRVVMPYDRKTYKPIPPSSENRPFVSVYPCFDYLQKADPSLTANAQAVQEDRPKEDLPKFTQAQVLALEGIGISEERLYSNSFDAVSVDDKRAMLAGEAFDFTGRVRVMDGLADSPINVQVNGKGKMLTSDDGKVSVRFQPQFPLEMRSNQVLDIDRISRVGKVQLQFYETYLGTDKKMHVKKDVYGNKVVNQAFKDLMKYGQAFGPVDGVIHEKTFDNQEHKYVDSYKSAKYQVCLVNGGVMIEQMVKVPELDKDGNQIKTKIGGKEVDKFHYEIAQPQISKDGTVRVGSQNLQPATQRDMDNYRRGIGGRFPGYEAVDFKTKQKVTYDAFVTSDLRNHGFSKVFSEKVSQELNERFAESQKTAKKQNFSMGF